MSEPCRTVLVDGAPVLTVGPGEPTEEDLEAVRDFLELLREDRASPYLVFTARCPGCGNDVDWICLFRGDRPIPDNCDKCGGAIL